MRIWSLVIGSSRRLGWGLTYGLTLTSIALPIVSGDVLLDSSRTWLPRFDCSLCRALHELPVGVRARVVSDIPGTHDVGVFEVVMKLSCDL